MTSSQDQATAQRNLLTIAQGLLAAELHIVPIGANKKPAVPAGYTKRPLTEVDDITISKIRDGKVRGLGVVTGAQSLHDRNGTPHVLVAFELEGKATTDEGWMATWADALAHTDADGVMNRLDTGWVEDTPSGGRRWFFRVPTFDADHFRDVIEGLAGRTKARQANGSPWAEMLLSGHSTIVAPSYGSTHPTGLAYSVVRGSPDDAATLSVLEVHTLADALAEVDEVDRTSPVATWAALSGRAREVQAALEKQWTAADTVRLLKENGWETVGKDREGAPLLERSANLGHGQVRVSNGKHGPSGSVWTFSTSAAPFEERTTYRALRVVAILNHDGDVEAAAQAMLDSRRVSLKPFAQMPRTRPGVFPLTTDTSYLVRQLTRALVEASHPTIDAMPFVLAEVTDAGAVIRLLSVTRDGGAFTWGTDARSRAALLLSVAQPTTVTTNKKGKKIHTYTHALPHGVVDSVLPGGAIPSAVSRVRFVGANPLLTPDGHVVSEPGLHTSAQALVTIPRVDRSFWSDYRVPERPSQADAQKALDYLLAEVASGFPFETQNDLARYVAYLLTAVGRSLCTAAPMFAFDAADRGTGKGLAARVGRLIAFGTDATQSVGFSARDDEENRKALVSAALDGRRVAHIDELPRDATITSTVLSELVTDTGSMALRVLGGNATTTIPPMLTTVCGNNIQLGADFNRRVLPIRMVHKGAGLAFERSCFRHSDLTGWVRAHRPELLAAAHTILAHGLQNPVKADNLPSGFGSFEAWSALVLGALTHVNLDGQSVASLVAADRRVFLDAQDEEGADWGPLMTEWVKQFNDMWVSPTDARKGLTGASPAVELPPALLDVAGQGDAGTSRRWGRELTKRRSTSVRVGDQVFRFEVMQDSKRGNKYRIATTSGGGSEPAPAGEVASTKTKTKTPATKVARKTAKPVIAGPAPTKSLVGQATTSPSFASMEVL